MVPRMSGKPRLNWKNLRFNYLIAEVGPIGLSVFVKVDGTVEWLAGSMSRYGTVTSDHGDEMSVVSGQLAAESAAYGQLRACLRALGGLALSPGQVPLVASSLRESAELLREYGVNSATNFDGLAKELDSGGR